MLGTSHQRVDHSCGGFGVAEGLLVQIAYFSDRGRLEQADRGRRNDVAGEALG